MIHVVPLPEDYISLYEHEFASKAIGHRGMSKWEKLILGSVCEKVVRSCTRPVIVVR